MPAARIATLPYFYFDCGNDDAICASSGRFAALLREKKIPHEYRQLPGNHSWAYWDQQVQEVLKIAARQMHARTIRLEAGYRPPSRALARLSTVGLITAS
jgi:S-formylglutathione hydrolase FrmB